MGSAGSGPGKKMRTGERIIISEDLSAEILGRGEFGERIVRLEPRGELFEVLEKVGHVPLPPYIRRPDTDSDKTRYQTVFAQQRGSVAAPTAGLHFTPEILAQCHAETARVTLHVRSWERFSRCMADVVEDIKLHEELFSIPPQTFEAMDRAKRVIAVGTTSVRAIENGAGSSTRLFLYPGGATFRRTGAMPD